MNKERIGLFGGTFNPIHSGHLRAADIVQKRLLLDKILFIPSYIPPHKNAVDVASPAHRLKMVEIALRSYPHFSPSSIEVDAEERSYSVITLGKIRELYPNAHVFFILGIDAFLEIDTWKDYDQVLEQCFFVVISRPGFRLKDAETAVQGVYREKMHELSVSDTLKDDTLLTRKIFLVSIDALDVSSTNIRQKLRKGESITTLVPEEVEAYIQKERLYQR